MKTALYIRVSDKKQHYAPQQQELALYASRREWGDLVEYSDTISGAKFTRSGLDKLMRDVRRGRVGRVLVVKLDRLGRSLPHLAQLIGELEANKVALIATSQGVDTSDDSPMGRMQRGFLMLVAEFERDLIRERTKAGLIAAVARGVKLGRKALVVSAVQRETLAEWHAARTTYRDLAVRLGVSVSTAHELAGSKKIGEAEKSLVSEKAE